MLRARAAETGAWIVYVNTVGGQDELVFDGGSLVLAPDGTIACRAVRFDEDLLVVQIDDDGFQADSRPPWSGEPEDVYRALVLGTRDYVHKNGFTRGRPRALRRGRLRAGRRDRGGRPRAGRGPRARDAEHVLEPGQRHGRRGRRRPPRHPPRDRSDHGRLPRLRGTARRPQGRRRARRREPPGAHPWQRPDGAVEPVRVARARDREQERVRGRLLDALRRHGRRVRTDQGRPEDARLRALPVAQRDRPSRTDPRVGADEAAVGGAPARSAGHGLVAAVRGARPDHRRLRGGRPRHRRHRGGRRRGPGDGHPRRGLDRPGRVQTASGRPRGQDHPEGVRSRPAAADHEPLHRPAERLHRKRFAVRLRHARIAVDSARDATSFFATPAGRGRDACAQRQDAHRRGLRRRDRRGAAGRRRGHLAHAPDLDQPRRGRRPLAAADQRGRRDPLLGRSDRDEHPRPRRDGRLLREAELRLRHAGRLRPGRGARAGVPCDPAERRRARPGRLARDRPGHPHTDRVRRAPSPVREEQAGGLPGDLQGQGGSAVRRRPGRRRLVDGGRERRRGSGAQPRPERLRPGGGRAGRAVADRRRGRARPRAR